MEIPVSGNISAFISEWEAVDASLLVLRQLLLRLQQKLFINLSRCNLNNLTKLFYRRESQGLKLLSTAGTCSHGCNWISLWWLLIPPAVATTANLVIFSISPSIWRHGAFLCAVTICTIVLIVSHERHRLDMFRWVCNHLFIFTPSCSPIFFLCLHLPVCVSFFLAILIL